MIYRVKEGKPYRTGINILWDADSYGLVFSITIFGTVQRWGFRYSRIRKMFFSRCAKFEVKHNSSLETTLFPEKATVRRCNDQY